MVLMYFADLTDEELLGLEIVPLQIRRFQLVRPSERDIGWMQQTLNREYSRFDISVTLGENGHFTLSWSQDDLTGTALR